MADTTQIPVDKLRAIPLLRGLDDHALTQLSAVFDRVDAVTGDVLFDAGQAAEGVYLLTEGEVRLLQDDEESHLLKGPVLIGELGGLTGIPRNSRAVVADGACLYRVQRADLLTFFDRHCPIGLALAKTLLSIAADKINRDQTRLQDMRANLIRTQKAMKKMRDFLLESVDTAVSEQLHGTLEGLIEQNRRVNYRVAPPPALAASVRLDGGGEAPVVQISRTHVSFVPAHADTTAAASRFSGVLRLSGPEIPISGKVLRVIDGRMDLELDLLLDEYATTLEAYLTRVQMLDFLV